MFSPILLVHILSGLCLEYFRGNRLDKPLIDKHLSEVSGVSGVSGVL
jgi:hypothetical protein